MLAYDVGTSGVKASMISGTGKELDSASRQYNTFYAPGGIAEQDSDDWWNGVCNATRELIDRNHASRNNIAVIGVSGHMLGCLPVAADGMPLYKAMIHSDSRADAQFRHVCDKIGAQRMYEMTGNVLDARSSLCKIMWLRDNESAIYKQTAKFLQCKDYIVSKLTGNIDVTDYSDACHAELMDITKKAYDSALFAELGLEVSKLPTLHKGCDIVGSVTEQAARLLNLPSGIPVIAGGGDGACGSAGAGCIAPGDIYLNFGTTAWLSRVTENPVIDSQGRVFNIMNLDGETCSVYGTMQSAGSSIVWVKQLLGVDTEDELNSLANEVAPGCDGLVFLPYLDGERSPVFDANARGVFLGISRAHDRRHFSRAVFEGTAYAIRNIADIFRESDTLDAVRLIGGGGNSLLLRQMIADICRFNLQTLSVSASNATSLGIAAVAGTAVGIFPSIRDATEHIKVSDALQPGDVNQIYERNYEVYLQMYPGLRDAMHRLSQ